MSLCFLSLESSKVFNKLIFKNLVESNFDGLSEALIILFPYITESNKITSSQLSKQIGYSRQAMHKNIKKLEEFNYIILEFENQKEKVIKLTPKGEKLLIQANKCIQKIENELSTLIGKKELTTYKKDQARIYDYLVSIS